MKKQLLYVERCNSHSYQTSTLQKVTLLLIRNYLEISITNYDGILDVFIESSTIKVVPGELEPCYGLIIRKLFFSITLIQFWLVSKKVRQLKIERQNSCLYI